MQSNPLLPGPSPPRGERSKKCAASGISDHGAIGHDRPARDRHDAVADDVGVALRVGDAALIDDAHATTDTAVLVEDGALDHRVVADEEVRDALLPVGGAL